MAVLLSTALGEIVVDLFADAPEAPIAACFVRLCAHKFYDGCLFYNVQPRCLAQTGDPTGTGSGGRAPPAPKEKKKPDDLRRTPDGRFVLWEPPSGLKRRKHDAAGLLSIACVGKVGGGLGELGAYGSQFFFTLRGDDLTHLDEGLHCVVGEVAEGLDVLEKLGALYLDDTGRPWQDARVRSSHVLDDPWGVAAEALPEAADESAEEETTGGVIAPPAAETIGARVPYGAKPLDDSLGDPEERARLEADKKAKSQAQVLEMIGDLPHADVEVPKNEIFIAKLNKVTEDRDLEIIFSRFGKIQSCDVVRDWKTGDSLNFAFIAFEDERAAVEAYKKMNNVLIDDSRVKVDFSQSVAKIWSRYTLQYKKGAKSRDQRLQAAQQRRAAAVEDEAAAPGHYGPSRSSAEKAPVAAPPSERGDRSSSRDLPRREDSRRHYDDRGPSSSHQSHRRRRREDDDDSDRDERRRRGRPPDEFGRDHRRDDRRDDRARYDRGGRRR